MDGHHLTINLKYLPIRVILTKLQQKFNAGVGPKKGNCHERKYSYP